MAIRNSHVEYREDDNSDDAADIRSWLLCTNVVRAPPPRIEPDADVPDVSDDILRRMARGEFKPQESAQLYDVISRFRSLARRYCSIGAEEFRKLHQ